MIRTGISTACFYPQATEQALYAAAQAGAGCAEVFINAEQEFSAPFFSRLGHIARETGVEIVSIHPFTAAYEPLTFFSDYPRRFEDGMERYRRYFALSASLGARYFILHGAFNNMKISDEESFERFAALGRAAEAQGVTLLQENVSRCKSHSPAYVRAMRAHLGDAARFVLDTKQAVRAGCTVEEMRQAMGDALRHVHISDYGGGRDCIPPGTGAFDIPAFLRTLEGAGFCGAVIMELYRSSYDTLADLCKSYEYLASIPHK